MRKLRVLFPRQPETDGDIEKRRCVGAAMFPSIAVVISPNKMQPECSGLVLAAGTFACHETWQHTHHVIVSPLLCKWDDPVLRHENLQATSRYSRHRARLSWSSRARWNGGRPSRLCCWTTWVPVWRRHRCRQPPPSPVKCARSISRAHKHTACQRAGLREHLSSLPPYLDVPSPVFMVA